MLLALGVLLVVLFMFWSELDFWFSDLVYGGAGSFFVDRWWGVCFIYWGMLLLGMLIVLVAVVLLLVVGFRRVRVGWCWWWCAALLLRWFG